ncbi:hypothetical protein [Bacteroides thetaiotaomicron]|uniref:hypothetical protein n=1 Tax=Bacteroides thetaiotaomicron TaxID=818 RepID=UPI000B01E9F5|nr:hypothetical protein [Bacteroides thetaiotaomicron]
MEQKNNKYYSYISEYYAANPTKFEKRKNNLKPVLYLGLAVVGAVLAIFPGLLPLAGWLVRTAGIIMTLVCLIAAYLNNFDIYNFLKWRKSTRVWESRSLSVMRQTLRR